MNNLKKLLFCVYLGCMCHLTACDHDNSQRETESALMQNDLTSLVDVENTYFKKNTVFADGKSKRNFKVVFESKVETNDHNVSGIKSLLPLTLASYFCNGLVLNSVAQNIIDKHGSIEAIFTDKKGEQLLVSKISPKLCRELAIANVNEVMHSLRDDGVFTRRYVEHFILPLMQKQLPNKINDEFEATNVELGSGASIIFTITYTPIETSVSEDKVVDNAGVMVQELYAQVCKQKDTREFISRLDKFMWQVKWQNKIILKHVASPTCR